MDIERSSEFDLRPYQFSWQERRRRKSAGSPSDAPAWCKPWVAMTKETWRVKSRRQQNATPAPISGVHANVSRALKEGKFLLGGDCPVLLGCLVGFVDTQSSARLLFVDRHEDA